MLGRSDDDQLVAMNRDDGEARVGDGEGNYAEVDGVIDDALESLGVIGALDADGDFGIGALEFGEDLGEDVEAGAFVGADNEFAAGNALGLRDGDADRLAGLDGFLCVFQEQLSGLGEGDFATRAVEQASANFLF